MPTVGEIMSLGWRSHQAGDLHHAEQLYRQVIAADPDLVDAWYLCGVVCQVTGRLEEAIAHYRQALHIRPRFAEVQNNLGVALGVQGKFEEAIPWYRQALTLKPDYPDPYSNLGLALTELGRLDEAIASLQTAVRLRPNYAEAYYILGNALQKGDRFAEAVAAYEQTLHCNPGFGDVYNNWGAALTRLGKLDEAVQCLRKAQACRPQEASVLINLANALMEQGQLHEALPCYQQALRLQPDSAANRSCWLVCLNYAPDATPADLFEEHRRWGELHGRAPLLGPLPGHDRDPERRLRVGYFSPDFYHHAASRFIEPILANHDGRQVETYCYAEVGAPDAVTARLHALAHHWRSTFGLSDMQVVERVRADRIDILVDLAGHTAHGRLGVFTRKPAPVQVTYLGYPNTTGLETIDYRLTDEIADPSGEPVCHTETLLRLPGGFCSYAPPANAPAVAPLPAVRNGYVTLGSLQNLAKLNARVLDLWAGVLNALPAARLLLFRHTLVGGTQEYFRAEFARRGIVGDRLRLEHVADPVDGYFGVYHGVDIALDCFPWSGHTTACEALWMGVPVLALYGNHHAGRMAASVLHRLGLDDWIARTPEQYVDLARRHAGDWDRLAQLRAGLREQMRQSSLCDGKNFTQNLEQVFRTVWRRACGQAENLHTQ
jgi:predicted O-linked N-acetylglucosamine transferase (SPINDLY family)